MSASWWLNPLLCIDTETTGVDPFNDRIVEVAAVDITATGQVLNGWSAIVDPGPGVEIPDAAAQVHGITNTRASAEGIEPRAALALLADRINEHIDTWTVTQAPIVMFNARFDWTLLLCEAERHGIEIPPFCGVLDPMLIDRMVDRYRKGGRKLTLVAAHYGVELSEEDAHGGLADATAAGHVMRKLLDRYPQIGEHSLATLWLRQVKGHEDWRAGFEDYLRRNTNPDADIPAGWPIPTRPELRPVAS